MAEKRTNRNVAKRNNFELCKNKFNFLSYFLCACVRSGNLWPLNWVGVGGGRKGGIKGVGKRALNRQN